MRKPTSVYSRKRSVYAALTSVHVRTPLVYALLLLGFLDVRLVSGPRVVDGTRVLTGTVGRVTGPGLRPASCVAVSWYGAIDINTGQPVRVQELCVGYRALEWIDAIVEDEPRRPL